MRCGVIGGAGCGALRIVHVLQELSDDQGFLAVDEEGSEFGFGGRGCDEFENGRGAKNGALFGFVFCFVVISKVEVSAGSTA